MKKALFLFGAGAVLDWSAPSTLFLTDLIRKAGFKNKQGNRISDCIYLHLLKHSANTEAVNFETIINYIEELYNYYSSRSPDFKGTGGFYNSCNLNPEIENLIYYIKSEINPISFTYSLSIPGFEMYTENGIPGNISPEEKYYQWLINELLGGIIGKVSKYSAFTKTVRNVIYQESNELLNNTFCRWMQSFIEHDYCLRMYTLNYDRIFKILLTENGIPVFEGFDLETSFVNYSDYIPPNIIRIATDFNSNVFYNLHGSANWHIEPENVNGLPSYQYYLCPGPMIANRSDTALIEMDKGRKILLSNIITGYQKTERTSVSPFRQMLSAFDRDCMEAAMIFLVGYSYGDEHINDIIRNARKYNKKASIILINPGFDDAKFMFDFMLHWDKPTKVPYYQNEGDEIISADFNIRSIQKKFGDFLNSPFRIR